MYIIANGQTIEWTVGHSQIRLLLYRVRAQFSKDITILHFCAPNNRAASPMRQIPVELKREIRKLPITVGDFSPCSQERAGPAAENNKDTAGSTAPSINCIQWTSTDCYIQQELVQMIKSVTFPCPSNEQLEFETCKTIQFTIAPKN